MPKRKSESQLDYIVKKLKYLEKEIHNRRSRSRRRRHISSSSSDSSRSRSSTSISSLEKEAQEQSALPETEKQQHEGQFCQNDTTGVGLNPEILDIFGVDPTTIVDHGPPINPELANRLSYIATSGLKKEERKEITNKYLVPENCLAITAPELNPEIKAALSEGLMKRDKALESRQKSIATVISCLSMVITTQINSNEADHEMLKHLFDASRLLCDIQYTFKLEDDGWNTKADSRPVIVTPPAAASSASHHEHLPTPPPSASATSDLLERRTEYPVHNYPGCRNIIRTAFLNKEVPVSAIDIMMASLSSNTIKQYDVCIKRWYNYCQTNNIDLYQPNISTILNFLTDIFHNGSQYGTINSHRSALSLILGKIMENELISRYCKGVYRLRPTLPKYNITWDVSVVLEYLGSLFPHENISLEQMTKKCSTLIALVTAHRVQTISKMYLKNVFISDSQILIKITDLIKSSRPGVSQPVLRLPFFSEKPQICPAKALMSYMEKTQNLRKSDNLFISFRKPYNSVTSQSISRWIKDTLRDSGVDVSIFSAHSTRHASTSTAYNRGVNVDLIRNMAGRTGNSTTFARFYNRVIVDSADSSNFAKSICIPKNID
ncbi:hypothetical protein ABMA28_001178 [Loxostege sticticalis]|uniref:Tyr recombinase domain-containing protein n=1 Tax=Loxostege sticticalis TaxID=481309 RepID=A0ABD0T6K3_LOXSC